MTLLILTRITAVDYGCYISRTFMYAVAPSQMKYTHYFIFSKTNIDNWYQHKLTIDIFLQLSSDKSWINIYCSAHTDGCVVIILLTFYTDFCSTLSLLKHNSVSHHIEHHAGSVNSLFTLTPCFIFYHDSL